MVTACGSRAAADACSCVGQLLARFQDLSVEVIARSAKLWVWANRGMQLVKVAASPVTYHYSSLITPLHTSKSKLSFQGLHARYFSTTPRTCLRCRPVIDGGRVVQPDDERTMLDLENSPSFWVQIGYFGTNVDVIKYARAPLTPAAHTPSLASRPSPAGRRTGVPRLPAHTATFSPRMPATWPRSSGGSCPRPTTHGRPSSRGSTARKATGGSST